MDILESQPPKEGRAAFFEYSIDSVGYQLRDLRDVKLSRRPNMLDDVDQVSRCAKLMV